ncbi:MAG: hypothetical protein J1E84_08505 [Muribaculaceae bacterium]|nr:hypothetical protein [Muribaculaceae bacterium]
MKQFTKKIALAIVSVLIIPTIVLAQGNTGGMDYMPGFFGHPLLKSKGYKAEQGKFDLEIAGTGSINNVDNITDSDPDNVATTVNLAGLTLAYDEIVRVFPDGTIATAEIPAGKQVGFVVSPASDDVNVLNLSVIKMMTINFLDKDGNHIAAAVAKGDDNLNVVSLNLVSVSAGGRQKITAKIPDNLTYDADISGTTIKKGDAAKVYGVSLSTGGVDVNVGHEIKIYYAFIDDFELVPIIKKYYPNAVGNVDGMSTGSKKLVNNNLEDGASTAILTVGGTYYTVTPNAKDANGNLLPFPRGVEAGWVMTSGTALSLAAGEALQIIGIDGEGKERIISTDVNVVGLNLLGGGNTVLPFMTPVDYDIYAFKLNRINVLELNLGATLVNYAYIKLPVLPDVSVPFDVSIEAVPGSEVLSGGAFEEVDNNLNDGIYHGGESNPYIRNNYKSYICFANNPEMPLKIPPKMSDDKIGYAWYKCNDYWNASGLSFEHNTMKLVVTRKAIVMGDKEQDEDILRWYDFVYTGEAYSTFQRKNELYYRMATSSSSKDSWSKLDTGDDGVIDVAILAFEDNKDNEIKIRKKGDPESGDNIIGYEYRLYLCKKEHNGNPNITNEDECTEIGYSAVTIPAYMPEYELAGKVDYIDVNGKTLETGGDNFSASNSTDGPIAENIVNKYRHYVSWTVPDENDEKTIVENVTLYRYYTEKILGTNTLCREPIQVYKRIYGEDGVTTGWESQTPNGEAGDMQVGWVHINGETKLVTHFEEPNSGNQYGIELKLALEPNYRKILEEDYKVSASKLDDRSLDYGWYWVGEPEYTMPTLTNTTTYYPTSDGQLLDLKTEWSVNLNECKDIHLAQLSGGYNSKYQDLISNVDILYNQWSTLTNAKTLTRGSEVYTDQNVVFNDTNTDAYYIESADLGKDYVSVNEQNDTHKLETTISYSLDVIDEGSTSYQSTTRAYIPVVPNGFQTYGLSDGIQTYLALEATSEPLTIAEVVTGMEDVEIDNMLTDRSKYEYFNMLGIRVKNPMSGVYLRRDDGGTVKKVIVK